MQTIIVPSTNKKAIAFLDKIVARKEALLTVTEAKIAERRVINKTRKLMAVNG